MDSENAEKISTKYSCTICLYNTCKKTDYHKHLATNKHIKRVNDSKNHRHDGNDDSSLSKTYEKHFDCICGKQYKYDTGYYRHKKTCTYVPPPQPEVQSIHEVIHSPDTNWMEIIQVLVNENKEIRNFMVTQHNTIIEQNKKLNDHNMAVVEQNKTLTEVVKTLQPANNSYNTTNNNNQSYTINMFLHEKCKDAQNFSKFIEELKPKVDMMKIYENGYVEGISKLFIDGLSSMEITERPLHCTDERRNTFYVHDNDEWNKDENLKDTKKAIFHISQENMKQCVAWSNNIPPNTDRHDHITQSVKLCKVAWSGDDKNTEKIIKNISKEIPLNKQVMNEL
jgi:hypothetical protein